MTDHPHLGPRRLPETIEVIDWEVVEVLRRKTPAEKLEMVTAANRMARLLVAAGVRAQHPDWSPEQVQAEVARRMLIGST